MGFSFGQELVFPHWLASLLLTRHLTIDPPVWALSVSSVSKQFEDNAVEASILMTSENRSAWITALSLFFAFGTVVSGITVYMLSFPGSVLEPLWTLNPRARDGFTAMGSWALLLMVLVCTACATAAIGLWRRTRWGFWTAVTVLTVNLAGDTANVLIARDWRTLIGLPIGGLMLAYLVTQRRMFERPGTG